MNRRPALVTLLLLAMCAQGHSRASADGGYEAAENPVLVNAQQMLELRSRAARLRSASGASDTTYIGYTPGRQGPGNWWSIYAGSGKDGYYRPGSGGPTKGMWDFDATVNGDSLQGWWPMRALFATTGGSTQTDRNRPWWAIDIGNQANYRSNLANGRTFGVIGVWHRDGGLLQPAPAGRPTPGWTPAQGSWSAWMGVRAHGDVANVDPITLNPFNEDLLMHTPHGALSQGGNDRGFPGYGSQMDQMLYRDIDLSAASPGSSLTIRFRFRTVMSTGVNTTPATRTGWFDSDPLGTVASMAANPQLNNFISSSDAGSSAPRDSFMVYVGRGIDGGTWLPAAANFGQSLAAQPVYDAQRRWFGEVMRWDRDPNGNPANPQPLHYWELLSVMGVWPARADTVNPGWVDTTFVIPSAALPALTDNGRVRLAFRVKTDRGFDDQGSAYSSNTRGAAAVDAVSYRIGAGPEVLIGDFENPADIDNDTTVTALQAWKSTGKPPTIYHHVHPLATLDYDDICGQEGDVSRICNLGGIVVSGGDHDHGEASASVVAGSADRELNEWLVSPTICLADDDGNPNTPNVIGLYGPGGNGGVGDVVAGDDLYLRYDVYTGVMNLYTYGNAWLFGAMSYPGNAKASHGSYPAWGQVRLPPTGPWWNDVKQCLSTFEHLRLFGLIRTSNPSGIPDSIRVLMMRTQQCFRFGISSGCSATEGTYWDNLSVAIVDGGERPLTVQIWDWINDAFPANETPGLPSTASFDTAAAHVMTGLNTAQWGSYGDLLRFDVPGDSVTLFGDSQTARVDMVFRILPGPGNYEPVGRPDLGTLVRRPDGRAIVTKGDGSFWDQYRQVPGDFATPGAVALHHNAVGGWDPNVWNSARCDTAEINFFARQAPGSANVLGGPMDPSQWMSTYHESDPHFATLGIVKNRCFVTTSTAPRTSVICDGAVPSYISSRPEHADVTGTTKEFTKILPDGQLTAGAHVEYFFRAQGTTAPGSATALLPDTNIVIQPIEGSTDGHRWQQFGIVPNRWKNPAYRHPVAQSFGNGPACLLVVDGNDRRGNERVWVGIADTIGATPQRWWGAHNGWHAVGDGDVDVPADNRVAKSGTPLPGYVAEHLGQPGSGGSWDMYQVKGSESSFTSAGSLGSRKANRIGGAGQQIEIAKSSRQGPTVEMLNTFYTMMLYLSGDLNYGVLGPIDYHSQNEAGVIIDWLDAASNETQNRGFWAIGDGFAESILSGSYSGPAQVSLIYDYMDVGLGHGSYTLLTGNTEELLRLELFPGWQGKAPGPIQIFGVRNLCLWTNDVLFPYGYTNLTSVAAEYAKRSAPGSAVAIASVFKDWDPSSPYKTLLDGWDIEHLTGPADASTVDRSGYFHKIFTNVWSKLCAVAGTPLVALDAPGIGDLADFVSLRNNPLARGRATIRFGLARADRVEVNVYDVGGRLVRTLADRRFAAGTHDLTWDGDDDRGRAVARGVYFTRIHYHDAGFTTNRKLTVLKP